MLTLSANCYLCNQEDEIIIELVNKYGPKKWSTIAQHLPGRIGKQCRERYDYSVVYDNWDPFYLFTLI